MELDIALRGRRSIRSYRDIDIPESTVTELIDLARHAPSSMNGQPWLFIVIRDKVIKQQLADLKDLYCPDNKKQYKATMIRNAPVVIIICVHRDQSHDRLLENGVLAGAQLMLAAHAKGIGSVFMTAYQKEQPDLSRKIQTLLSLPQEVEPIVVLPLGFPDERPAKKELKPLESIIYHDRYLKSI
ncbi:MAG: nitroreductase family protein [Magnetococcales bacterium]|nr:nitroreductase family protein [Magnetococcales bacterium]MBF0116688.1 nitroreductase family protein [Magnetococcales bacterium]